MEVKIRPCQSLVHFMLSPLQSNLLKALIRCLDLVSLSNLWTWTLALSCSRAWSCSAILSSQWPISLQFPLPSRSISGASVLFSFPLSGLDPVEYMIPVLQHNYCLHTKSTRFGPLSPEDFPSIWFQSTSPPICELQHVVSAPHFWSPDLEGPVYSWVRVFMIVQVRILYCQSKVRLPSQKYHWDIK